MLVQCFAHGSQLEASCSSRKRCTGKRLGHYCKHRPALKGWWSGFGFACFRGSKGHGAAFRETRANQHHLSVLFVLIHKGLWMAISVVMASRPDSLDGDGASQAGRPEHRRPRRERGGGGGAARPLGRTPAPRGSGQRGLTVTSPLRPRLERPGHSALWRRCENRRWALGCCCWMGVQREGSPISESGDHSGRRKPTRKRWGSASGG